MTDHALVGSLEAGQDRARVLVHPHARLFRRPNALLDEALKADRRRPGAARLRLDDDVAFALAKARIGRYSALFFPFAAQRAIDAANNDSN